MYDAKKHAMLIEAQAKLIKSFDELGPKLMEEYNSDEWSGERGPAKLVRYQVDQLLHAQLTREITFITAKVQNMESLKPVDRKAMAGRPQDVLRRWMHRGRNGVEQHEAETYLSEPSPEMIQANPLIGAGGHGGEVFDPYSMIRMAASDPMRSDKSTGAEGLGAAAPETWARGLVESLKYAGSVADSCQEFSTSDGNDHHINSLDTKDNEGGTITDQSKTAGTGTPAVAANQVGPAGDVTFKSFIRHSEWMSHRLETLSDVHFDVGSRIIREANRRMGRGWNRWFTTGSGTGQPEGIVNASNVIKSGSAAAGGVTYKNLTALEYAVDLAYLISDEGFYGGFEDDHRGLIGFMMNRNIEHKLRSLLQPTSNLPVWVPNLDVGMAIQGKPGSILGYMYSINNHMADGETDNDIPLLFGNFGHYCVRNIGGPMIYRFWDSATARNYSVSFIGFSRRDGRTLGPLKLVDHDFGASKSGSKTPSVPRCEALVGLSLRA